MHVTLGDRTPGEHFQYCIKDGEITDTRIREDLRHMVDEWVRSKIKQDIQPTMDAFYEEFPCFDHRNLYDDLIEAAIEREKELAS